MLDVIEYTVISIVDHTIARATHTHTHTHTKTARAAAGWPVQQLLGGRLQEDLQQATFVCYHHANDVHVYDVKV